MFLVFAAALLVHGEAAAQGSSLDERAREEGKKERLEALEKKPGVRKPRFRGYTLRKKYFDRFCDALAKDSRRTKIFELADSQDEKLPDCIACYPFFRQLATSCKPKKSKSAPTKTAPQREPHIEVLVVTLDLMQILAEEDIRFETLAALERFLFILRSPSLFEVGEAQYYSLLADYMETPFERVRSEKIARENAEGGGEGSTSISEAEKEEALENLF